MTENDAESGAPKSGMSLAKRLTYAILFIGLLGVFGEIASRAYDYAYRGIPLSAAPNLERDLILVDSLGPRGKPNGSFRDWHLNSVGFRSSESVLTPRPGCVRVMTLGSSETFGAGSEGPGYEYPAQRSTRSPGRGCLFK